MFGCGCSYGGFPVQIHLFWVPFLFFVPFFSFFLSFPFLSSLLSSSVSPTPHPWPVFKCLGDSRRQWEATTDERPSAWSTAKKFAAGAAVVAAVGVTALVAENSRRQKKGHDGGLSGSWSGTGDADAVAYGEGAAAAGAGAAAVPDDSTRAMLPSSTQAGTGDADAVAYGEGAAAAGAGAAAVPDDSTRAMLPSSTQAGVMVASSSVESERLAKGWKRLHEEHGTVTVADIVGELTRNGRADCLRGGELIKVAEAKAREAPMHRVRGSPRVENVTTADMLAVICYTGTAMQSDLRQRMLEGRFSVWPKMSSALHTAIHKLGVAFTAITPREKLYHGLHGIRVPDFGKFGHSAAIGDFILDFDELAFTAPTSTSRSKQRAVDFACGDGGTAAPTATYGVLLQITITRPDWQARSRADVSWISKFQYEREVLVAPFKQLHVAGRTTKRETRKRDGATVTLEVLDCYF